MYSLVIRNMCLSHGGKQILDDLSFQLPDREIHILMGPNGIGKSSLLHALVGQYPIDRGEIFLFEKKINSLPPEEISQLGLFLAFQSPVALPGVSISQFLRTALQARLPKGQLFDHAQFHEDLGVAMDMLGIDPSWASRCVHVGFSGGEKKLCDMLQILILKPRCVLFDEIDSGLDVDAIHVLKKTLSFLREKGTSMLFVTHHGKWLEDLCPEGVHIMGNGRIIRSGSIELMQWIARNGFQGIR